MNQKYFFIKLRYYLGIKFIVNENKTFFVFIRFCLDTKARKNQGFV